MISAAASSVRIAASPLVSLPLLSCCSSARTDSPLDKGPATRAAVPAIASPFLMIERLFAGPLGFSTCSFLLASFVVKVLGGILIDLESPAALKGALRTSSRVAASLLLQWEAP
jgi:hypothetical protein